MRRWRSMECARLPPATESGRPRREAARASIGRGGVGDFDRRRARATQLARPPLATALNANHGGRLDNAWTTSRAASCERLLRLDDMLSTYRLSAPATVRILSLQRRVAGLRRRRGGRRGGAANTRTRGKAPRRLPLAARRRTDPAAEADSATPPELCVGVVGCGSVGAAAVRALLDAGCGGGVDRRRRARRQAGEAGGARRPRHLRQRGGRRAHMLVLAVLPAQLAEAARAVRQVAPRTVVLSLVGARALPSSDGLAPTPSCVRASTWRRRARASERRGGDGARQLPAGRGATPPPPTRCRRLERARPRGGEPRARRRRVPLLDVLPARSRASARQEEGRALAAEPYWRARRYRFNSATGSARSAARATARAVAGRRRSSSRSPPPSTPRRGHGRQTRTEPSSHAAYSRSRSAATSKTMRRTRCEWSAVNVRASVTRTVPSSLAETRRWVSTSSTMPLMHSACASLRSKVPVRRSICTSQPLSQPQSSAGPWSRRRARRRSGRQREPIAQRAGRLVPHANLRVRRRVADGDRAAAVALDARAHAARRLGGVVVVEGADEKSSPVAIQRARAPRWRGRLGAAAPIVNSHRGRGVAGAAAVEQGPRAARRVG